MLYWRCRKGARGRHYDVYKYEQNNADFLLDEYEEIPADLVKPLSSLKQTGAPAGSSAGAQAGPQGRYTGLEQGPQGCAQNEYEGLMNEKITHEEEVESKTGKLDDGVYDDVAC